MKTDVVIPFLRGPLNSIELRYALRSIEKNLKAEVTIWLYGEKPDWVTNVNFVPVVRQHRKIFVKFFDQLRKIEMACRNPEISKNFVYTYDDIYLLKPVTVDCLKKPRALENMTKIRYWFKNTDAGGNWVKCMKQTLHTLQKENLPIYNYETHLPRVYNKEKALAILEKYRSSERAFQFATMYFNNYYTDPEMLNVPGNFFKLGIYRPVGYTDLRDKAERSTIMNMAKITDDSVRVLEVLFPEKCRWEKAPGTPSDT